MSRTWKDKPWKLTEYYDHGLDSIRVEYEAEITETFCRETWQWVKLEASIHRTRYYYIQQKSTKPKVRKSKNTEWRWYKQTPSWWTRLFMNKPQRRKGRQWERKVLFEDIEDTDPPGVSRKPHKYYF